MARRRLFSLDVVDTDAFLEMPCSTQALYFHLGMRADDDGFVSSPKRIVNTINASLDDLKLLIAKGFIIPFDTGVCVLRDWKIHNTIQKDRYKPTLYQAERAMLQTTPNNQYLLMDTPCIQNVSILETQDKLSKDNSNKDIYTADKPQTKTKFSKPSVVDIAAYCQERGKGVDAQHFFDYYEANGWKVGKNPMKDWKAAVRTWERNNKSGSNAAKPINNPDKYQYGKEYAL